MQLPDIESDINRAQAVKDFGSAQQIAGTLLEAKPDPTLIEIRDELRAIRELLTLQGGRVA